MKVKERVVCKPSVSERLIVWPLVFVCFTDFISLWTLQNHSLSLSLSFPPSPNSSFQQTKDNLTHLNSSHLNSPHLTSFVHFVSSDSCTNFSKKHSLCGIHDFSFFSFFFVTTNPSRSCGYEHVAISSSHVFIMQNHGFSVGIATFSGTNRHFPQNGF